ncbi:MAG: tRNA dimethylallyltransferase [Thermomicrobiales bacterium]
MSSHRTMIFRSPAIRNSRTEPSTTLFNAGVCRSSSAVRRSISRQSSRAGAFRACRLILRFALASKPNASEHGVERLIERLTAVDPASAERCGVNPRRIIRALEIYEITGVPMSELEGKGPRPYDTLELGLWRDRGALYTAIDQRIDRQIDDGLVGEVEQLLASGVPATAPAFSSIGYRQPPAGDCREESLAEGIARIKHDTHRYVRHQETWLRANPRLIRIDVDQAGWIDDCAARVAAFLAAPDTGPF